jgi:hypothetical protein
MPPDRTDVAKKRTPKVCAIGTRSGVNDCEIARATGTTPGGAAAR